MSDSRIHKADLLNSLPVEWPDDLLPEIQEQVAASQRKVVVLDDDPTGTQTVQGIPVLTEWSIESLRAELQTDFQAFYILTNSRSLPLDEAQALNREIGGNLREASRQAGSAYAVVSRSDSTLRGHFPGEVDALVETLDIEPDAWLVIPFFLEGGRYTINDVHYVAEGETFVPASETPFAQDAVFGYTHSNLRDWVAEKTDDRFPASDVASITIADLRSGGPGTVAQRLLELPKGSVCAVNAGSYCDLEVFVAGLLQAEAQGRQFIYRTAASFVRVRAGISPRPMLTADEMNAEDDTGGLVVVGSYVPKTTNQLTTLLDKPGVRGIEIKASQLLNDQRDQTIDHSAQATDRALSNGEDVVLYTSRTLITGQSDAENLNIGQQISSGLIAILRGIATKPRYLIAKGGITSSDVATKGLNVRRAMIAGQIIPGVPVWELGAESRFPGLMYVVFPGNVGDDTALANIVASLKQK